MLPPLFAVGDAEIGHVHNHCQLHRRRFRCHLICLSAVVWCDWRLGLCEPGPNVRCSGQLEPKSICKTTIFVSTLWYMNKHKLHVRLQMTGLFQICIRFMIETESLFTSVERVRDYITKCPSERPHIVEDNRPSPDWPKGGDIRLVPTGWKITLRYFRAHTWC